ncbi:MAG: hypothetical protein A2X22_12065 [Bacteroidetes bacterium GWF2_49_14]|nr:MAG: hypothetical protein A2X22_12065 [Bacteroidetes bacterium GWF2_49_14]
MKAAWSKHRTAILLLGMLLGLPALAMAQKSITGRLIDAETRQPVQGANIRLNKIPITSSDSDGRFEVILRSQTAILLASHVSYHAKELIISKQSPDSLIIQLVPKTMKLDEVLITAQSHIRYFKPQSFYIHDYAIKDHRVWAIGYENKNVLKPELRVLGLSGELLAKMKLKPDSRIFQDPTGTVLLFRQDSIYQLTLTGNKIQTEFPGTLAETGDILFNLQVMRGDTVIYRTFNPSHSICEFLSARLETKTLDTVFASFDRSLFKTAASARQYEHGQLPDRLAVPLPSIPKPKTIEELRKDNPDYSNMSTKDIRNIEGIRNVSRGVPDKATEATLQSSTNFAVSALNRTIIHKPVEASLFFQNGQFTVFEATNSMIWNLNSDFTVCNGLDIELNNDARELKMAQDPATGKLYITYRVNGSPFVCELDTITGEVIQTRRLEGFPFAEKIRVYDNRIYFIYQAATGQIFTNLFSISI